LKILVTGATGFIGRAFVSQALARGHTIAALARPETLGSISPRQDVRWFPGTLQHPPLRDIEAFGPDTCLHAAWIATPGVYLDSPLNRDYLAWSISLATSLRERGLRHLVGLGTCIEYRIDPCQARPLHEKATPVQPHSLYASSKDQLRLQLEAQSSQHPSFHVSWGRVFYPYGPGEHPARLCSTLIAKLARGDHVVLRTPGSTKDYIYIDDLAAALVAIVEMHLTGPINLGTGWGLAVRHIAAIIARLLHRENAIHEEPQTAPDPLAFVVADPTRLRTEANWSPGYDLEQGLAAMVRGAQLPGCQ